MKNFSEQQDVISPGTINHALFRDIVSLDLSEDNPATLSAPYRGVHLQ